VTEEATVRHYAANPKQLELLNREIERVDLGVRAMQLQQGGHARLRGLSMRAWQDRYPFS
jgi:hypothetical protein